MHFIDFFGKIISSELDLSVYAAKGLLKLAIKDELGPFYPMEEITYSQIKWVITNSLINRLKDLGIQEIGKIEKSLIKELVKNQSLLTFGVI
ncbi:MAG: hypothetical protein GF353_27630 [Candidatus Lokiarchaeota archaeon]|nr:hypothetical protein [Candidatus Lokiarchaeota archaeon]